MCTSQLDHSEMFTELYREEKKEEGDRSGQEDKRGEIKRRETDPASNQFPKCSPLSGTHRDSQSWVEKRGGREETEATWWRKRRVQSRGEQSSQQSRSQVKMGTEDWVLKGTKSITNTKKQKLKI